MLPPHTLERAIERLVREEWGRILSVLVKDIHDFQLAEDCLQDAVLKAMDVWRKSGLPKSAVGWLVTVARRRAIDRLRRRRTIQSKQEELSYLMDLETQFETQNSTDLIPDKRLEMIFTCCHPALEEKTRVALTLRTLGGLSTAEIAAAFLDKPDAMTARLTRAKKKIAAAHIPYAVPEQTDLAERLGSVLKVIYLIFNEGVSGDFGLSGEAIRLARIVLKLMPDEPEVAGLLALMLIHDARRAARVGAKGEFVPLDRQNRARWDQSKIAEGVALLESALTQSRIGPFQLQAAINAVHGQAAAWDDTDWTEIAALYGVLHRIQPSEVVKINLAVAVSYADTVDRALAMLDAVTGLENYQPYWATRADFLNRSGRHAEAKTAYIRAIKLCETEREAAFLRMKMERS